MNDIEMERYLEETVASMKDIPDDSNQVKRITDRVMAKIESEVPGLFGEPPLGPLSQGDLAVNSYREFSEILRIEREALGQGPDKQGLITPEEIDRERRKLSLRPSSKNIDHGVELRRHR